MSARSRDPRLAAYTVLKAVGKGSYGEVFLAKNGKDRKQYVIKNIKLTASSAKERLAAEQEASLLSKLQHPNIVSYKESFTDDLGILHIVMGYCEGGDLCSRLKTYHGQLLPETQVVEWFVQIALALQYLHERNILHRDLKTQNIFLSKNDIIKVGDLGIARVLDGSCDLAHTVIGTPYYMSPELFANKPYNHKSDIWALGCCVYEMATLKHAFTARNLNALMYKVLQGKVPPLPPSFSPDLSTLVRQMLGRSAKERPSVHQILRLEFVRKHIRRFLDRAASRKRKARPHRTSGEPSSGGRVCEGESGRGQECLVPVEARRRRSSSDVSARNESSPTDVLDKAGGGSSESDKRQQGSLPQHRGSEGSGGSSPESSRQARAMARKPPRPLPPSPAILRVGKNGSKADSKPPAASSESKLDCKLNGKPPAAPGSVKPSARERRRRHKQQEAAVRPKAPAGRVVLRSRASSDPQRRNDVGREGGREAANGSGEREGGREATNGSGEREGGRLAANGSGEREGGREATNSSGEREGGREAANGSGEREGGREATNSSGEREGGRETTNGSGEREATNGSGEREGGREATNGSGEREGGREATNGSGEREGGREAANGSGEREGGREATNDSGEREGGREATNGSGEREGGREATNGSGEREGGREATNDSGEREGGREATNGSGEREGGRLPSREVEETDGPSESAQELHPDPAPLANGSGESHSSEDSNKEMEDFFTLLDTTLHLPDPAPRPHPPDEGVPQPREGFTEGGGDGGVVLPSGRLKDRIAALRHECLSALGASLMDEAYQLLDRLEPEEAEEALLKLLGGEVFESHAAKLQQLKMCEDSLYEL